MLGPQVCNQRQVQWSDFELTLIHYEVKVESRTSSVLPPAAQAPRYLNSTQVLMIMSQTATF